MGMALVSLIIRSVFYKDLFLQVSVHMTILNVVLLHLRNLLSYMVLVVDSALLMVVLGLESLSLFELFLLQMELVFLALCLKELVSVNVLQLF
jgi:hypothetical protein